MAFIASFWDSRNRSILVAAILALALLAFEIFNFDTTKFALNDLLGATSFFGLTWASILAFAFCAIDFAGLVKIFTPHQGMDEPKEVWYLMGAWLLGATMNAIMTWYAISVLLVHRPLGTEVLSREQLLTAVPIFVAVLVWLTRILFIGSLSVAGEHLMAVARSAESGERRRSPGSSPLRPAAAPRPQAAQRWESGPVRDLPNPGEAVTRIRRRPPIPGGHRPATTPMRARGR